MPGFDALEAMAGEGRYLGGATPGIADCCLVPQMYNARRFDVPVDDFPRLVEIDTACRELDAFGQAHPDAVKAEEGLCSHSGFPARKSVVEGKSVSVRVGHGGR